MANESNKKKKKSGGAWWLIFVVIALLSQASEGIDLSWLAPLWHRFRVTLLRYGITLDPGIVLLAAVVAVLLLISVIVKAAKRRGEVVERKPATARTSAAIHRPDPRSRSFTPPEPSCIVCDHTGEDHFQHDKAQRIQQLGEWLKNGLIDREEYKVLKARYERDL